MKVKIVGTGSAVPEKCVTNDDLSQWMDTSDEWIRSRTGIETRHLAVRETTTEMAVEAAKRALASAHMDAEEPVSYTHLDVYKRQSVDRDFSTVPGAADKRNSSLAENAVDRGQHTGVISGTQVNTDGIFRTCVDVF